jgi:protein TonB
MYADRFDARRGVEPRSLALALAINGAVLLAIATASPELVKRITDPPLTVYPVPLPPEPRPIHKPAPHQRMPITPDPVTVIQPVIDPLPTGHAPAVPLTPAETVGAGSGNGNGPALIDPPAPPFVEASIDPAFARDLQPPYPPDERRAGNEGRVVVRVLIGTDGRVDDIQPVSATSASFFEATRRQALGKWHFRAATRGGVAVESWRRMSVSFRMQDSE